MNLSADTPPSPLKRSATGPLILIVVIAAVAALAFYWMHRHAQPPSSPAAQARWRSFQQENARQSNAAEQAFERRQAAKAAGKVGMPHAAQPSHPAAAPH